MNLPVLHIQPEAQSLLVSIKQKVLEEIDKSKKIPVSVLLWGPSPQDTSEIAKLRIKLRTILTDLGHLVQFSEELIMASQGVSIKTQQLIHAQQFDIVVSIPCTHGSLGEIHDFISDNRVNRKLLIFLNEEFNLGYSFQSIVSTCTTLTYRTVSYNGYKEMQLIENTVLEEAQKIREVKYFNQGKWI
jgi:hypothetical protein